MGFEVSGFLLAAMISSAEGGYEEVDARRV